MYVHLHVARKLMGWGLGLLAMAPSVLCFETPASSPMELSEVTGRMTYFGKPLNGMILCLDSASGVHCAFGSLRADGSFRLINVIGNYTGAVPGRYHAHLYTRPDGPSLPAKYADSSTSGLEIEIASDWNELTIDLQR
jgi:hypothetical protein